MNLLSSIFLYAMLLIGSTQAWAQNIQNCGDFAGLQFDYLTATKAQRYLVEHAHFTPEVEALISGASGYIDADIAYTLRASPNHHRALISLVRLAKRTNAVQLPHMPHPVECYFERAIRFNTNDHIVRMLYSQYLIEHARTADATAQLEYIAKKADDNPFTIYNIGLLYFDLKDYTRAQQNAKKALALGFPGTGLREMLQKIGQWQENGPSAPAASAPGQ
jgi:tetratricopeptide (TPR) repeat protein